MADGKSENSWRQSYSFSWLGGCCGAGEGVSHKHWQPRRNGDRRRRVSRTDSSTAVLLNKYERYHTVAEELNNCGLDSIKLQPRRHKLIGSEVRVLHKTGQLAPIWTEWSTVIHINRREKTSISQSKNQ